MVHRVTVLPQNVNIQAADGEQLLAVLRRASLRVDAPCGGQGQCGKCGVLVDGQLLSACRTRVERDLTVTLPSVQANALTEGPVAATENGAGAYALAFDIGTTTVAGYLLAPDGTVLCQESEMNLQIGFGADVISRIRHALAGEMETLTALIRGCTEQLALGLCRKWGIGPQQIRIISLVGNPAMQQLFLGIVPENLARIPYAPVLKQAKRVAAEDYLPAFSGARLLIVPNISGFVGADTLACVLSTGMDQAEELTLLVDIGTNGEMVLGDRNGLVACSTAAGPALEGAGIQCGMRAMAGAIDHVWREKGALRRSVIGGGEARGLCGSGLIDAVAVALDDGAVDARGRILAESRSLPIAEGVALNQEDIRQLQQAKGAIAAGIRLMARHMGIGLEQIRRVYLAGAFGSFLDPRSACRIGLLPGILEDKIQAVGNAAGSGARLLAQAPEALDRAQRLADRVEHLQLASLEGFRRCFADSMRFETATEYWCQRAKALGFSQAVPMDPATLRPREDVRAMCAADKCGAYGKNWTCPPHCGSLTDCARALEGFDRGILLQTMGVTEKRIDTKAYRRVEQQHLEQFARLCDALRRIYPQALCLGTGGCRVCLGCAYPEPCRFPEKACSSMEGYGLFVTQVCRDNGLAYHYGDKTVTYTACVLF